MKPGAIWSVAALCFTLLGGAMAWITHSMLNMERAQDRMAANAAVQEIARLALWRMESIASSLVIEESARPPEDYCTFAQPGGLLDNTTYTSVPQNNLRMLSPVLRQPSSDVLLYFEMDAGGRLRSPQVPKGQDLIMCEAIRIPAPEELTSARKQLDNLRGLLDSGPGSGHLGILRSTLRPPPQLSGNRALLWMANDTVVSSVNTAAQQPEQQAVAKDAVSPAAQKMDTAPPAAAKNSRAAYAQQQMTKWKPDEARAQQQDFNTDEAVARSELVEQAVSKAGSRRIMNNSLSGASANKKQASVPAAADKTPAENPPAADAAPAVPPVSGHTLITESAATASASLSDFKPFWIGDSLFLTRRAVVDDQEWIQGAWLNWENLRAAMLETVRDRFPGAQIVPAGINPAEDVHLLASLPVRLIPGPVEFPPLPYWTPLKVSLAIAWLCVLLAVAAVALVLRGMMALSERRASFVSSVTHELRTPLATFKLYSEMLADGMITEEAKRQRYLETLTGEADRLGHLVENVLAYSRIERGKGPAAASAIPVAELLDRVEPRLNQRALMAGMDFSLHAPAEAKEAALRTDAGAIEQILCNLVDNACKYGRVEGTPGKIELSVTRERRRVCFSVRDYGPGITRGEEKEIFLPFHKSAGEAAHTQPGVGLGLALCRRLAKELGGALEIDRAWRHGAAFVLRLPV